MAAVTKARPAKPAKPPINIIAICGLAISLTLPVVSFQLTLSARVTALETLSNAPSKDVQLIATMQQSIVDLRADLAEWKTEQRTREQATAALAASAASALADQVRSKR